MGACSFFNPVKGTDMKALFEQLRDESRYESGHSYSGEIGMKDDVVLRSEKLMLIKEAVAFAQVDEANNNKWDSEAFAVKIGDEAGNHTGFLFYGCAPS